MTSSILRGRSSLRAAAALTLLSLLVLSAAASDVAAEDNRASAATLKAAFLLNFAKFVEWPSDRLPPGDPLVICIAGDDLVAKAEDDIAKGQTIDGHSLIVRRVMIDAPGSSCHLLYLAAITPRQTARLIESLGAQPTMTVSDLVEFAQTGGIANFFVEGRKLRFAINADAAKRARLHVSSKLLSLAKVVDDTTR